MELPVRLAVLVGGLVAGGGADLWVLRPDLRRTVALAGTVTSLGFCMLLRAAWRDAPRVERRAIRWLGVAAVASAIPLAGTPIGSRFLVVPFVGGAALVAVVVGRWWTWWRHQPGLRARALGAASAQLAVVHLGFAPLGRLAMPILRQRVTADRAASAVADADLDPALFAEETAVVLVAPDLTVGLHGAFHRLPMPATWRVLSWAHAPHRFVRTASDTLEMEVGGDGIESAALASGTVVSLRGMEATVLAIGGLGPTRVRFRFERSLDDPSLTLLAWRDGRLRGVEAPVIGGTIVLDPDRGS